MTYSEFITWALYMEKRGSLSVPNRLESGFAMLASVTANVQGNKTKVTDFMPNYKPKDAPVSNDINAAMALLQSAARPKDSFILKSGG